MSSEFHLTHIKTSQIHRHDKYMVKAPINIVPCYAMLCCAMLCCAMLCCAMLYCTVPLLFVKWMATVAIVANAAIAPAQVHGASCVGHENRVHGAPAAAPLENNCSPLRVQAGGSLSKPACIHADHTRPHTTTHDNTRQR